MTGNLAVLRTFALLIGILAAVVSAQQIISTARRWSVWGSFSGILPEGTTAFDPETHFFVAQTLKYNETSGTMGNGTLTAVNSSTGTLVWQVYDGSNQSVSRSGLTLSDCLVHFWTGGNTFMLLWALHAANGNVAWQVNMAASVFENPSDPYAADGVVYVTAGHVMYAFDAATGNALPTTILPGYGAGRPLVIGDLVLVPEEAQVQAFTQGTNDTVYNASQINNSTYQSAHLMASADQSVVWSRSATTTDRYLTNFDAATGKPLSTSPPRLVARAELIAATASLAYLTTYGSAYAARSDLSTAWYFNSSTFGDNYDAVYCQAASEDLLQQDGVLVCFLPCTGGTFGEPDAPGILVGLDLNTGNLTWFFTIDRGDLAWDIGAVRIHVVRHYNVYTVIIAAQPDVPTPGRIWRFDIAVTGLPTPPPTQAPALPGIELMLFTDSWQCDLQTNYTVVRYESGCAASSVGGSILRFCSNAADGSQQLHEWVFAGSPSCDNEPVGKTTVAVGQCQSSVLTNTSLMVVACRG